MRTAPWVKCLPIALLAGLVLIVTQPANAQGTRDTNVVGTWTGVLDVGGQKLHLVFHIQLAGNSSNSSDKFFKILRFGFAFKKDFAVVR